MTVHGHGAPFARHMRRLACLLPLWLGVAGCSAQPPTATVTIDPSRTYQTIEAWEANARMWEFDKEANRFNGSWQPIRDQILEKLIVEGGITRLRLELRSGAENPVDYWSKYRAGEISYLDFKSHFYEKINDNDDPGTLNPAGIQFSELDFRVENFVLPAIQIARRHGRKLKVNLNYMDFRWTANKGTLSHAHNPAEYAELIDATYAHLRQRYGLVPDLLEVILEPDNTDEWRGRQIGEAMIAVQNRLKERGIAVRFIAPSTANASAAPRYFDELNSVSGAGRMIAELAYHRYDLLRADAALPAIVRRARQVGAQTAMLEHVDGTIDELMTDLTEADISSWQLFAVATEAKAGRTRPGYMLTVEAPASGRPVIALNRNAAPLAEIFHVVAPGAQRIDSTADQDGLRTAAFRNPDGGQVVVVRADASLWQRALGKLESKFDMAVPGVLSSFPTGSKVSIKGLTGGNYVVRRRNTLSGDLLICAVNVARGKAAEVYLRNSDLAVLHRAGPDEMAAPCPTTQEAWK